MESFFLAETTKYLYLLFDPENFLHNRGNLAEVRVGLSSTVFSLWPPCVPQCVSNCVSNCVLYCVI